MPDWQNIFAALREGGVSVSEKASARSVGGEDNSAARRVDTGDGVIFIKTCRPELFDMFEAEAEGLCELEASKAIRIPNVVGCGATASDAYLAIEWIRFDRPTAETERLLGAQLAKMHRHCKDRYGWHRDNTIGLTPQHNGWSDDWPDFFRTRRLDFQLELAARNGFGGELQSAGRRLSESLESLFRDYRPAASLLHGDLWGGNWAATDGQPIIFDPAVYYGDRESDIAMTQLFGGFGREFYSAYQECWPMEAGYEDRLKLYQLYHVLNHLNLFGSAYLRKAMLLIGEINSRAFV